jgi:hypothetical protein
VLSLHAMAVGATHPDYDAALATWARARDVLAGEDAVKPAGESIYQSWIRSRRRSTQLTRRGLRFFGATARTLEEYLDLVFRRAPVTSIGNVVALGGFVSYCDRWGTDFEQ